jgi:hypothetical protein
VLSLWMDGLSQRNGVVLFRRQPSLNRQSSNGVDVQSNLFGLSGRQDEPHVVVTLSEAPMQPLDDDDAGLARTCWILCHDMFWCIARHVGR